MDTFVKAIGDSNAATGKTKSLGGIEERQGATARGLLYTIMYVLDYYDVSTRMSARLRLWVLVRWEGRLLECSMRGDLG